MVSRGVGHDSGRTLRLGEAGELGVRAAHLEGAHRLEALRLELGPVVPAQERRADRDAGDPLRRGADAVELDERAHDRSRSRSSWSACSWRCPTRNSSTIRGMGMAPRVGCAPTAAQLSSSRPSRYAAAVRDLAARREPGGQAGRRGGRARWPRCGRDRPSCGRRERATVRRLAPAAGRPTRPGCAASGQSSKAETRPGAPRPVRPPSVQSRPGRGPSGRTGVPARHAPRGAPARRASARDMPPARSTGAATAGMFDDGRRQGTQGARSPTSPCRPARDSA